MGVNSLQSNKILITPLKNNNYNKCLQQGRFPRKKKTAAPSCSISCFYSSKHPRKHISHVMVIVGLYKIKEGFDVRLGSRTSDHRESDCDSSSELIMINKMMTILLS